MKTKKAGFATRAIHVAPEQLSVWSAVVKYSVPTTIEAAITSLARVLGGRHYLREGNYRAAQREREEMRERERDIYRDRREVRRDRRDRGRDWVRYAGWGWR